MPAANSIANQTGKVYSGSSSSSPSLKLPYLDTNTTIRNTRTMDTPPM